MANSRSLQEAERETLDLLFEVSTAQEWGDLLKAPLERALAQGNNDIALKLVAAGARTENLLHEAVARRDAKIVDDLLQSGVSLNEPDIMGRAPLHVAAGSGETAMVTELLLKGADKDVLDNDRATPLWLAASHGQVDAALALVAAGADVQLPCGKDHQSMVHIAAEKEYVVVLRAMIEHGADVNVVDRGHCTPLHLAARHNSVEAVDILVQAGANTEARDLIGFTPIRTAVCRGRKEALLALVRNGADINAQDELRQTPLFDSAYSAGEKEAEMVDLLLRSGADETIPDEYGVLPVDVVGKFFEGWNDPPIKSIERVRLLLANAPADRAWRRRRCLVLCRAFPDRMQGHENSRAHVGDARRTGKATKHTRAEVGRGNEAIGGGAMNDGAGATWAAVIAKVLRMSEDGIFRKIVCFL